MKLEKAIENREAYLKNSRIPMSIDDYNATLLSIEALKLCQKLQDNPYNTGHQPLPGQTTE